MIDLLLDADAWIFARKLSLLDAMLAAEQGAVRLQMTEYVARRELSQLEAEVRELCEKRLLSIHALVREGDGDRAFRALRRTVDKGEAEAIAWLLGQPEDSRPVFVSCDVRAREAATARGLASEDLMGLVVRLVSDQVISREIARAKLEVWSDRRQQLGRPRDYHDFDSCFAARASALAGPSSDDG